MPTDLDHGQQPDFAFEPTSNSVVLQTRLHSLDWTNGGYPKLGASDGDLLAVDGYVRFELATDAAFGNVVYTSAWLPASAQADGIVRHTVGNLTPLTRYYWRVAFGTNPNGTDSLYGKRRTFRTLPDAQWIGTHDVKDLRFAVASCWNHEAFLADRGKVTQGQGDVRYMANAQGEAGVPAWQTILFGFGASEIPLDGLILTGDTIYYDGPGHLPPTTLTEMRQRWHRFFGERHFIDVAGAAAIWNEKDDHDWRFDDADPSQPGFPSPAEGTQIWHEQVYAPTPPYRWFDIGRLATVYLIDVREFRDSAAGTLLGATQLAWLQSELTASVQRTGWQIIVTPTPIVGPDRGNHNDGWLGADFVAERDAFVAWLGSSVGFSRVVSITGDRHWQYYAESAEGLIEFSVGPLNEENVVASVPMPGDPDSTDPLGLVTHYATRQGAGFVTLLPYRKDKDGIEGAFLDIRLHDEDGTVVASRGKRVALP